MRNAIEAGHRTIIKHAMRAAGVLHLDDGKGGWSDIRGPKPAGLNDATTDQLNEWAKNNPREMANSLHRHFEKAGRAYERSTDGSKGYDLAEKAGADYHRMLEQGESVLSLYGITVDYPGIYPHFQHNGRDYRFDELRRVLDDASATHRVTHDGRELYRSTEAECFGWLQRNQSASVHHATTHEGYAIEPLS